MSNRSVQHEHIAMKLVRIDTLWAKVIFEGKLEANYSNGDHYANGDEHNTHIKCKCSETKLKRQIAMLRKLAIW